MTSNPTLEEVQDEILASTPDDWDSFDAPQTWVLTTNRDISIRLLNRYAQADREIDQPDWASVLPNPTSHKNTLRVEFRGAPIHQLPVRELDEFRITMVQPDTAREAGPDEAERVLTDYEAHLSRIMSMDDFDGKVAAMDVRIIP